MNLPGTAGVGERESGREGERTGGGEGEKGPDTFNFLEGWQYGILELVDKDNL